MFHENNTNYPPEAGFSMNMTGMVLNLLAMPFFQMHVPVWEAKPNRWEEQRKCWVWIPPPQLDVPGQCSHWAWPLGRRSVCSATTRGDWGNNTERKEMESPDCIPSITPTFCCCCTAIEHSKPNLVGWQHLFAFIKFAFCWTFSLRAERRLLQHLSVSRFSRSC